MCRLPVIIDCDPGHDDAMAILWTLASKELDLKAVTTVSGNASLEKVTNNAIKVLTKAGILTIPVAKGAEEPLVRNLLRTNFGTQVHGESGMGGPALPENGFAVSPLSAVETIIQVLENSPEPVAIIAIGPLTNVALMLKLRPDLKEKIQVISIMGGGARRGNWTPTAEYNIYADVEAAYIVFHSGVKLIMSGLDVTHKAYITREENERLRAADTEVAIFVAELIDYFSKYHYEVEGLPGCTLHDPTAVAALTHPEWFSYVDCNVEIELEGAFTKGMTVVDDMDYLGKVLGQETTKNARVMMDVNRPLYVDAFIQAMASL